MLNSVNTRISQLLTFVSFAILNLKINTLSNIKERIQISVSLFLIYDFYSVCKSLKSLFLDGKQKITRKKRQEGKESSCSGACSASGHTDCRDL